MEDNSMQKEDFNWFLENYQSIYKQYGACYVAIKNQTILGIYENYKNAVDETKKSEALGTFIIQFCNGSESGYTNYVASNEVGVI